MAVRRRPLSAKTLATLRAKAKKSKLFNITDLKANFEDAFGDIATRVSEGKLKRTGEKVYSIYPSSSEMPEERYI